MWCVRVVWGRSEDVALTVQSGSQQQLPSQLPSVRSHVHEPTDVTVTVVAVGVSGTAVQSAMGYVGNALVPAASAGLVCASTPALNPATSTTTIVTVSTHAGLLSPAITFTILFTPAPYDSCLVKCACLGLTAAVKNTHAAER